MTKKCGYYWQDYWNKGGYAALIPQFGGGRKPKLTDEQMIELKSLLKKKDLWTTREVLELIKEKYGVLIEKDRNYTEKLWNASLKTLYSRLPET